MRVTAIGNRREGRRVAIGPETTGDPHISPGRQYEVHALTIQRGEVWFQIQDDSAAITWLPAQLFETSDSSVPKDWICNWFTGEPEMVLGPEFVARDQESYRRMAALDPTSVAAFQERLKTATGSSGSRRAGADDAHARPPARSQRLLMKLAVLVGSVAVACGLAEAGLRLFFKSRFPPVTEDERSLMYCYDRQLGWFPAPNRGALLFASRAFTVTNNSEGFRAPEPVPSDKPGIIFLGDSFVWGYDVNAEERFTDKLQAKHPEWSVYNFGVSGYGTDQEYLLLNRYFDQYKPRVVFLLFCEETDHEDNRSNMRYGGYYKPYCTITGNRLELKGIPVPRGERVFFAEHPRWGASYLVRLLARGWFDVAAPAELHNPEPTGAIIRDLQRYVLSKRAIFVMGLTRSNPDLETFLRFFKIPYVDLSNDEHYPGFGQHWTPQGHTLVCQKIEQFLLDGKYLQ